MTQALARSKVRCGQHRDLLEPALRRSQGLLGEDGSPTLRVALRHFPPAGRALEIGYGYGRDLVALARRGLAMTGIDPSDEGRTMAEQRLTALGLSGATLMTADFTDQDLPPPAFDAVLSHRTLHLMTAPGSVDRFARKLAAVVRPGAVV